MSGMRNEGNDKLYSREDPRTTSSSSTARRSSRGRTGTRIPRTSFFRRVFAKAAGKENADDVDAAGIDNIFFKENCQMGIDAKALGRYCSEKAAQGALRGVPGVVGGGRRLHRGARAGFRVARRAGEVRRGERRGGGRRRDDARLGLARSSCARRGWNG